MKSVEGNAPEIVKPHGSSARLPCLDGLRAAAILLVLFAHARHSMHIVVPKLADDILHFWGARGVGLFFGLSGYLITHLLLKEHERKGSISLKHFYIRRALRILPVFGCYMVFALLMNWADIWHNSREELCSALFFYKNYTNSSVYSDAWFVGHMWSLSMEEQFYLFWPPLLVVSGITRARKIALVLALSMPVVRIAAYYTFHTESRGLIVLMFHTTMDAMLWGCLLALYAGSAKLENWMTKFRSIWFLSGVIFFYLVIDPLLGVRFRGGYELVFGISLRALSVLFIIAWVSRNIDSLVSRSLNYKWVGYIGVLSYSLYLWQQPFMHPLGNGVLSSFPFNLLGIFVVASLSYHLLERNVLRLRERFRD